MIRLVLFDIDGTLIQTSGAGVKAFGNAFSTTFGIHKVAERINFAGQTDTGILRKIMVDRGIDPTPDHFQQFFEAYVFWLDYLLRELGGRVCPHVWEFTSMLENVRPEPILGLLTGNIRLGAEIKLRHFNLWNVFNTGAFADDHEDRDQISKIAFHRGCELNGLAIQPSEVLVIGDTPLDIKCGHFIGAKVLAVATGTYSTEELKKYRPFLAVDDLTQVDFQELLK